MTGESAENGDSGVNLSVATHKQSMNHVDQPITERSHMKLAGYALEEFHSLTTGSVLLFKFSPPLTISSRLRPACLVPGSAPLSQARRRGNDEVVLD